MMLGVSGIMPTSDDGDAAAPDTLDGGGGSCEVGASSSIPDGCLEESERSGGGGGGGGGNRWPRQETLALLNIRSDMDVAFRDSSLKGPLWEEVSRKMEEAGFHRNAKKCKEKFENVYKYHKRTKDGRASKPDGKSYRFFDQLQALESRPPLPFTPPPPPPPAAVTMTAPPQSATNFPMPSHVSTVPSLSPNPLSMLPPNTTIQTSHNPIIINNIPPFQPSTNTSNLPQTYPFQPSQDPHILTSLLSDSSSSSTSSDDDIQRSRRGRKRKWKDFFERLMKEVVQKQEDLQKKFLETLEKRERDSMAREEAWRVQEISRMNREHDLLVQERSNSGAKDAVVIAFLQKVTEHHNLQIPNISSTITTASQVVQPSENPQPPLSKVVQPSENPQPPLLQPSPPPSLQSTIPPPPPPAPPTLPVATVTPTKILNASKKDNGGSESFISTSSSRWPKTEIEALIKLRTNLDLKYEDNGSKGPLWEEISAGMGRMGYSRSAKRCKEKWENINKYYKKVKESSKKRPEDSKTCPYFHQLEALYREKDKNFNPSFNLDNQMVPIMARPEQQWPNNQNQQGQDNESENNEEDDDEYGGGYEIVTNKQPSLMTYTAERSEELGMEKKRRILDFGVKK